MRLDELDYHLPSRQIAQHPLNRRDGSRLLTLRCDTGEYGDHSFSELPQLLRGDELLVLNNTRVIPARLFARRAGVHGEPPKASLPGHLTGRVEVLLTRQIAPDLWEALVRPGRKLPVGERVLFGDGELEARIIERGERGLRTLKFASNDVLTVGEHVDRLGHIPLPPYIARADQSADRERYQTVFAKHPGAVAAPTAGLHFTADTLAQIERRGAEICELTLDVGLGTFQPIHTGTLENHVMHAESYEIPEETAERIERARGAGRPVLAIGTTVVRALEASALRASESGSSRLVVAGKGEARLFISPGFCFRVANALLTNFHLPRSTLLALVYAFGGSEHVRGAYTHAVEAGYRFYSYGDCMLIR
jgi:S-adenosylmethionine:tRNA ribosyltransferase-isomerase